MHHAGVGGALNIAREGFPLRPGGLSLAFKRAVTALGYGDLNFHALRHTYATTLLEQGEHPLVVSTNLGHSDI